MLQSPLPIFWVTLSSFQEQRTFIASAQWALKFQGISLKLGWFLWSFIIVQVGHTQMIRHKTQTASLTLVKPSQNGSHSCSLLCIGVLSIYPSLFCQMYIPCTYLNKVHNWYIWNYCPLCLQCFPPISADHSLVTILINSASMDTIYLCPCSLFMCWNNSSLNVCQGKTFRV